MDTIKIIKKANYAIVQLSRGKASPINMQMLKELRQAWATLAADTSVKGIILTGQAGIFTVGLDLKEIYYFDEKQIAAFWKEWQLMITELTAFPKPTICAISGHSPAGGCVLAICCDYRIMADGEVYTIGLNEIAVGIAIPTYIFEMYAYWLGKHRAYQYLMQAKLHKVQKAHVIGLVDEICALADLQALAETRLKEWIQYPSTLLRPSKLVMRKEVIEVMQYKEDPVALRAQLDSWFAPTARAVMGALVKRLEKR